MQDQDAIGLKFMMRRDCAPYLALIDFRLRGHLRKVGVPPGVDAGL